MIIIVLAACTGDDAGFDADRRALALAACQHLSPLDNVYTSRCWYCPIAGTGLRLRAARPQPERGPANKQLYNNHNIDSNNN